MILKKIIINNKEVFETISFEEALKLENHDSLIFTNEDEEVEFFDKVEELEELEELNNINYDKDEEDEERTETNESNHQSFKSKFNFNFENFGEMFGSIFGKSNKNSKSNKLISALPFMSEEDIHKIVEEILQNSEEYQDINLVAVMPFLSKMDRDALFMKFIVETDNDNHKYIYGIAPFVSTECFTKFVDGFIDGKYQDVNINALYPFMNNSDVKRVFDYIISKK